MDKETSIMRANVFQIAAHDAVGQKRKFSGLPYYTHPQAVAHILQTHVPDATVEMIIAAYLHDTMEDTKVTYDALAMFFGREVADMVDGLTNRKVPGYNRAEQKRHDAHRMAMQPFSVKVIKLCDRLHNLPDIIKNDPKHAKVYVPETRYLLDTALIGIGPLDGPAHVLYNKLDAIIKQYEESACTTA